MTSRAAAGALAVVLAAPALAGANPDSGVDAQLYRPALDPSGLLTLEGVAGLPRHDFSLKLGVGFAQDPLKLAVPGIGPSPTDDGTDSVLESVLAVHLAAAFGLGERLTIGFDLGVLKTSTADGYGQRGTYRPNRPDPSTGLLSLRPVSNIDPSGDQTHEERDVPSDVRVGLKYRLTSGAKLGLAVVALVSVPFGDEEMFLGDQSFVLEPRLAVEYRLGGAARLLANLGARLRKRTVLEAYNTVISPMQTAGDAQVVMDLGSEVVAGAGLQYQLMSQLQVAVEATAFVPLPESVTWGSCTRFNGERCKDLDSADYFAGADYGNLAVQALAGVQYRVTGDTSFGLAGGAGLLGEGRSEDFRLVAGVTWAPAPAGTRAIGRGDRDGDGVPDVADVCPDEPEDRDGYQDDDGCPDLDNDGDGIIDAQDACPDEPEDKDGFEDDDGCAERDNDGDGVSDVTDRCPNDKEDPDQFEDDDGCPEEDNDGDGIPDARDKCPNEPESVNGFEDLDGCPDQMVRGGPQLLGDRIDLQGDRVLFTGDKLTRASQKVLDDVARVLKANRDVAVRVEVHVALGTRSRNAGQIARSKRLDKQLSQRRADAIRDYLVRQGVEARAIAATVGLGADRPIIEPASDPTNERVDFIRTQQRQP